MMEGVSVLVPLSDDPDRRRVWDWLLTRYEDELGDDAVRWQFISTRAVGDGPWCKGRVVAEAYQRAVFDTLMILDADCWCPPVALDAALWELDTGASWVVPHDYVIRLDEDDTERLLLGGRFPNERHRKRYVVSPGGGCVLLTREAYETVGGIDPRFTDWGPEDLAFGYALETLTAPRERLPYVLWHLWHPPQASRHNCSPENEALGGRYLAAKGDPVAMRALIAERP